MQCVEATYPLTFRQAETEQLCQHLLEHNSVVLIGMKRIGISNFLRFFLHHPDLTTHYLGKTPFLFVAIDINHLVEVDLGSFWLLVLKRLGEAIEAEPKLSALASKANELLTESWEHQDQFYTLEAVRSLLQDVVKLEYYPVLFLIRFDRLQSQITAEFFANLQSLKDASNYYLSYVFTSHRSLWDLAPTIFKKADLSVFAKNMYIAPAVASDMEIILKSLMRRYNLALSPDAQQELLALVGGHVHYLHLSILKLKEVGTTLSGQALLTELVEDEAVALLSDEILEGLTQPEREAVFRVVNGTAEDWPEEKAEQYLYDTGLLRAGQPRIFSHLLVASLGSIQEKQQYQLDLTKKELLLFKTLEKHPNEVVEREYIIESVWPEQVEIGVSDWALDRLVARLRSKLKSQLAPYKIVTVVTRGYKLIKKSDTKS